MEDHARVLQQRIEVRALGGRREEAQERVGGEQHEEQEPHADEPPSTPVTRATISAGRRRAQKATAAPHHPSVTVQKRIEPS
ncbi:MAG: hypothetical protein ACLUNV_11310 [Sutterella wadsworthensis]